MVTARDDLSNVVSHLGVAVSAAQHPDHQGDDLAMVLIDIKNKCAAISQTLQRLLEQQRKAMEASHG